MRFSWMQFFRTMPAVLALVALLTPIAMAQDFDDDDQDAVLAPSLLSKLQIVHYGIISGRIVAVSSHIGTSMTHSRPADQATGRRERVSIDVQTTGLPSVHYEMSSPREELMIEVVEADQLTIRRTAKDKKLNSLEFQQPRRGDLVLSIGEGSQRTVMQAVSLWHLALAEPEVCRVELFPLLELLRPSWHLASLTGAIEESLSRWAVAHRVADRRVWQTWVESLGSPHFSERQAAERHLLDAGPAVLPFLEHFGRDLLDAEQRNRVRDLVALLDDDQEDTVDRVVTWLAADPEVWLSLLSRPDEARRRLAAQQLSQLLGSPVDFDAGAGAPIRADQLARLRVRLRAASATAPR